MIGTNTAQLLAFNSQQSKKFVEHRLGRRQYREKHPTGVRWLYCMESRGNPRDIFEGLPLGIGRSRQNLGAIFKPKNWPGLQASLREDQRHLEQRGRPTLWIAGSHHSNTDPRLGCKGHQCDPARTLAASRALRGQLDETFAAEVAADRVRSICASINTDNDAVTFYGLHGEMFDVATAINASPPEIHDRLVAVYEGQLTEQMILDLANYAHRNAKHVGKVIQKKRTFAQIDHHESMIFVGQSPEALCAPGEALVISPFDPSFSSVVKTAAEILQDNVRKYHLLRGYVLALVAAAPYHPSEDLQVNAERKNRAAHMARNLAECALQAISSSVRAIVDNLETLTGVVRMDTLAFELID